MTQFKITSLIFAFMLLFITSCDGKGKNISINLPGIDVPKEQTNTKITLFDDPGFANTYKNGDLLGLGIRNESEETINFPPDYGVKIFTNQGKGWEPVENEYQYPEGEKKLSTKKVDPTGLIVDVVPWISDLKTTETIRIVIIGHVENRPTEQVAAYIDISITP